MSFIDQCQFLGEDPRTRKWILPVRVMQSRGEVTDADVLLKPKPMQIGLRERELTVLKNRKNTPRAALLLDFGYEFHGGVRILTAMNPSAQPLRVRLTFGESVAEALSDIGEKGACNDHAPRDFTVTVPRLSDLEFGQTGYRFLRLELLDEEAEWQIKSVLGCFVYRKLDYIGRFSCSDGLLNLIYDTAAYTCHLNMQTMLWDGIKRDRLVWVGDTHPEMLAIRTLFADHTMIWENLRFSRDEAVLPGWMNGMPSYSFWWLVILYEMSFYADDFSFADESRSYTEGLLRQLFDHIRADGTHTFGEYFLDWQTRNKPEAVAGVHGLLYWAIRCGRELCIHYGNGALAQECEVYLERLKKHIPDPGSCSAANALLSLNGILPADRAAEAILKNGAHGMTTLMSDYILTALAESGHTAQALQILRTYYGGMLAMGATTFWEDFDLSWMENALPIDVLPEPGQRLIHGETGQHCYRGFRHSLCHGWSAGPVAFLCEQVLGIHVTGAGGTQILLSPELGDLQYARGAVPTGYGTVEVALEKRDGQTVLTRLKKPEACRMTLAPGLRNLSEEGDA